MIKPGTICWIKAEATWNEWGRKLDGVVVTVMKRHDSRGREAYEVDRLFDDGDEVTDLVERRHLVPIADAVPENSGAALREYLRLEAK